MRALLLGLLMAVTVTFAASAGPVEDKAQADGKEWLALLDSKHYADSWSQASALFRQKVDQATWSTQVKSVRDECGDLVSRKVSKVDPRKSLPGVPDGDYILLTYQSDFTKEQQLTETLVLTRENDHWRAAGYFIQ